MTTNLNGQLIKGDDINRIRQEANEWTDVVGGTMTQLDGKRTINVGGRRPWEYSAFRATGGWNPYLWNPTISTLSVQGTENTATTVLSVDNCVLMLGRTPYDFGSLSAPNGQVLSGFVFAVIQHPIWGNDYPDVSATLSCAPVLDVAAVDNNFSILPLYYVDNTGMTRDYRGIPTLAMYT